MYFVIWEYHVKADHVAEFESIYGPNGAWVSLFKGSKGFLKTELLRDEKDSHHYITIDRWASAQDYESFLSRWKTEYGTLDDLCKRLTDAEMFLGNWDLR